MIQKPCSNCSAHHLTAPGGEGALGKVHDKVWGVLGVPGGGRGRAGPGLPETTGAPGSGSPGGVVVTVQESGVYSTGEWSVLYRRVECTVQKCVLYCTVLYRSVYRRVQEIEV